MYGEKMSEHYFSKNPSVASRPRTWRTDIAGQVYTFKTDDGVFSKNNIDFGSRLLLSSSADVLPEGDILDMGCGYGVIGLVTANRYSEHTVTMVDVNERAVALARENAEDNHITNVFIYQSDLFRHVSTSFAAILSNPPIRAGKKVVYQLFADAFDHLNERGELWLVIRKQQGASSAIKALASYFAQVDVIAKKKGYHIIKAKKV